MCDQAGRVLPAAGTPRAQVHPDVVLVRALLAAQHPDLASLALRPVAAGWDNETFRLGQDLAVRLPRRALAATLLQNEQRWLPGLARRLPLPIPAPLRTGRPGAGYPWCWSVVPWLPGVPADLAPPEPAAATAFGRFLRALHQPAPAQAPTNPYRGVPLRTRAPAVDARIDRLQRSAGVDGARLCRAWQRALDAPPAKVPVWIHGDLHPRNVLVERGRLSAVIDWGDLAQGDPATDLAAAWMLFPSEVHDAVRQGYATATSAAWQRAEGWAVFFGLALLDVGLADDPRFAAVGRRTLARIAG